jgi:hypothetical protein
MIRLHYAGHASLVDPSTERAIRSPPVRRALVNVAKNVQRVANASCVPESQLEVSSGRTRILCYLMI